MRTLKFITQKHLTSAHSLHRHALLNPHKADSNKQNHLMAWLPKRLNVHSQRVQAISGAWRNRQELDLTNQLPPFLTISSTTKNNQKKEPHFFSPQVNQTQHKMAPPQLHRKTPLSKCPLPEPTTQSLGKIVPQSKGAIEIPVQLNETLERRSKIPDV